MEPAPALPRPKFHFTSQGWINDPHAITFANGRYHHFFQYVPGQTAWGLGCSWGHASGPDLFSLEELKPALVPGEGDDGVWSGSLIIDAAGTPTIFYTSVTSDHPALGAVRTATPLDDDWIEWQKGPIVLSPPVVESLSAFRDPSFIRSADGWHMIVGAAFADGRAGALGYSSTDGVTWREDGPVLSRSTNENRPLWSGAMWECPQIVEIDGQHALIVSVWDDDVLVDVVYALGNFADGVFTVRTWRRLSYGPSPYAATTFQDAEGKPCMMFWLREIAGTEWMGAHSIPYRISIEDDSLMLTPHPDLDNYQIPDRRRSDTLPGSAYDILWPASAENHFEIRQDHAAVLSFERGSTHLAVCLQNEKYSFPWAGDIRIIVDGPVVEVCSRAGVFAAPMAALEKSWTIVGADVTVYRLARE
ncbi:glycoside hydrolase family 32 protein [Arthrobacter sp. TB 23]|uniref:glycoside hydrolase family 32 protein n=1 Tax=Arthrobacter sp. TB 23 TaxID=494419 RepID=UPI0002E7E05E|nr:glycoside hydrolase family 32 protein [Arthrobacter sp. TB 23]